MQKTKAGFSRRKFLAGAGIAAASFVGAAGLGACSPAQKAASLEGGSPSSVSWDSGFDVVVVGFGCAGSSAAITAAESGASVLLIDKAPEHEEGGNTRYCEQTMFGWHRSSDGEAFIKQLREGHEDMTDEIVEYMVKSSEENEPWLRERSGLEVGHSATIFDTREQADKAMGAPSIADALSVGWVSANDEGKLEFFEYATWPSGEANNDRVFHGYNIDPPDNNEKKLWKFLRKEVAKQEGITVWYNAPAKELLQDPATKAIVGVAVDHGGSKKNVYAKNGVILACGSYEANVGMIQTFAHRTGAYPIGSAYNTGDGIAMAQRIGAQMWHMNALSGPWIEAKVPDVDRCYWSCNSQWRFTKDGKSIFVSSDAKRFMPESGWNKHGHVSVGTSWLNKQLPEKMWAIMDSAGYEDARGYRMAPENIYVQADTIEGLAEKLELDPQALKETVDSYNLYCTQGRDDDFGRIPETLAALDEPPFYGIRVYQGFVNAQGGPKRNTRCEVLDMDDDPIPHLYSAGELGSFFAGAYVAGGNISEALYTGRTAGANAAAAKEDVEVISVGSEAAPTELIVADDPAGAVECGENEYAGAADGIHESIVVKVTVENGKMTKIDVVEQHETGSVVGDLFETMPQRMIEANTYEVDTVSGATTASKGLQGAVAAALKKAGL